MNRYIIILDTVTSFLAAAMAVTALIATCLTGAWPYLIMSAGFAALAAAAIVELRKELRK